MQIVFFMVQRKILQTKTFSQKVFFMFCLKHFNLNCIIKMLNLKVNDPLKFQKALFLFCSKIDRSFLASLWFVQCWIYFHTIYYIANISDAKQKKNLFFLNKKVFFKTIIKKTFFTFFYYYLQFKAGKCLLILWSAYSCYIQFVKH